MTFLNPKGHQNPIDGSKIMAILLKGWILPVGGASAVEGLQSKGATPSSLYNKTTSSCLAPLIPSSNPLVMPPEPLLQEVKLL